VEKIKSTGADACGENGEYHTFVTAGPMYRTPLAVRTGETVDLGNYLAVDIVPADGLDKRGQNG
jgi:diphthamide synthase (EF-2-diphthine--ammonia ligase)